MLWSASPSAASSASSTSPRPASLPVVRIMYLRSDAVRQVPRPSFCHLPASTALLRHPRMRKICCFKKVVRKPENHLLELGTIHRSSGPLSVVPVYHQEGSSCGLPADPAPE